MDDHPDRHPDRHLVTFVADDGRVLRTAVTTEQLQLIQRYDRLVDVEGSARGRRWYPDPRPARR